MAYPLTSMRVDFHQVTATLSGNNQLLIAGTPNSGAEPILIKLSIIMLGQLAHQSTVVGTVTGSIGNPSTTSSSTNSTQTWSINVTAQNSANYQLSGNDRNGTVTGNDPTVTIALGDTLNFNVDAPGHPFYLKTQVGYRYC